ncbi:MAG: DUF4159 domain-containing protein [Neomegalonema sp.]|nr:DUF4159 domain-containing protein [Neomegalonema sp.]
MLSFGPVAFLQPLFLIGLLALPLLWWLLRATPPAARTERFPAVRVLLGLEDRERTPERTPWWLLLLRLLAAAALLLAFAQPVLNPKERLSGSDPLLIVMDGGWGSAPDWRLRRAAALEIIDQAQHADRPVALAILAEPAGQAGRSAPVSFSEAGAIEERLAALDPRPWRPDPQALIARLPQIGAFDTVWLHDGLDHPGAEALLEALDTRGQVTLYGPQALPMALGPAVIEEGALRVPVLRAEAGSEQTIAVGAYGARDGGPERLLTRAEAVFAEDETETMAQIELPLELRNGLSRLSIPSEPHAGAVQLFDERFQRRRLALVSGERQSEAAALLSSLHYLRAALDPHAAYEEMSLAQALDGDVDGIVMADIGRMDEETAGSLSEWVEGGGLLVRFAGPQLAAYAAERALDRRLRQVRDPLLPVILRGGGRDLGGALSWSEPQGLRAFEPEGPFAGLPVTQEVSVSRQVLAEPEPELAQKVWASLADGTPLVTAAPLGQGQIVLFHVSANASWSSLPLSGLFVQMMERLIAVTPALSAREAVLAEDLSAWRPVSLLAADGSLSPADPSAAPVTGAELSAGVRPGLAPGRYESEQAVLALNAMQEGEGLAPRPAPPRGVRAQILAQTGEQILKPPLLALGLGLLILDILAALFVAGRLRGNLGAAAALAMMIALPVLSIPEPSRAQDREEPGAASLLDIDPAERRAATETVLAYMRTGDRNVDRISEAGLRGLGLILRSRTSIEPGEPAAVDIDRDEIMLYSMIYWPITATQPDLSSEAVRKLNAFIRGGGMLVVDTRDAHQSIGRSDGPNAPHLRRLVGALDLPSLMNPPDDHTLTRSFYLLSEFPGRHRSTNIWVEAITPSHEGAVNANDGVSPILIGGNDWAGAWAVDEQGRDLLPMTSERQREFAFRFGINLAMYVYTGNYKSDQVHLPTIVERLGN